MSGISIARFFSHVVRVTFTAGAMLLIGVVASKVTGWIHSILDIRSVVAVLLQFLLIAIAGIAGGTYVSVRYITPNSIWHPVLAGALLGLFPVGVTFQGDAGLMRVSIVLSAIAIAAIAAVALRSRAVRPLTSLERTRER